MTSVNEDVNPFVASTLDIGHRLQSAREQKKLSVGDVANELRFTRATIVNLETEAWDEMHSRIYARGYLLSYVKFLGLPADDMLSAFNAQYSDKERPTKLLIPQNLPDDKPFPWLSSLLIIITLLIAVLIYQYWPHDGLKMIQQPALTLQDQLIEPSESVSISSSDLDFPEDDLAIQRYPVNAQDTRDVSKSENAPNALPMITSPSNVVDDNTDPLSDETDLNDVEVDAVEPQVSVNEPLSLEDSAPAVTAESGLTIITTEPSWVEVKDKDGRTLISRVLEPGTEQIVAPPPLAIRIGNVAGTTMQFNGAGVDLDAYRRNNIARLTLGADL